MRLIDRADREGRTAVRMKVRQIYSDPARVEEMATETRQGQQRRGKAPSDSFVYFAYVAKSGGVSLQGPCDIYSECAQILHTDLRVSHIQLNNNVRLNPAEELCQPRQGFTPPPPPRPPHPIKKNKTVLFSLN